MSLLEEYRRDMIGLNAKERKTRRVHWHRAAIRYLYMMALTSDPIPPLNIDRHGVTTAPFDRFFFRFPRTDLQELYRVTKPR